MSGVFEVFPKGAPLTLFFIITYQGQKILPLKNYIHKSFLQYQKFHLSVLRFCLKCQGGKAWNKLSKHTVIDISGTHSENFSKNAKWLSSYSIVCLKISSKLSICKQTQLAKTSKISNKLDFRSCEDTESKFSGLF